MKADTDRIYTPVKVQVALAVKRRAGFVESPWSHLAAICLPP
jgi:hypothetical protein